MGDRRRVGAARDADTAFDGLADRRSSAGKDLGRLGLKLRRRVRDVHAVGEIRGGYEERPSIDHQIESLVTRERAVLDAVDPRFDRGADAFIAMRVCRDPQAGAVRFVGDRTELLVGVLLGAGRAGV